MSEAYNFQGPTRQFTQPVEATVINAPSTCCLSLRMVGSHLECEKMPGLAVRATLMYGKKEHEIWVSKTWGDIGNNHEEHRGVCTGTRLDIQAGTNVTLKPIPKAQLIKQAYTLLARGIHDKKDAWLLRTIVRLLWPYDDDQSVKEFCLRTEPAINSYVAANIQSRPPSLGIIDNLFDRL